MLESLRSNLIFLRHLLRLQGHEAGHVLPGRAREGRGGARAAAAWSRLLDHREGVTRLVPHALRLEFREYLGEVERIVDALDTLHA